MRFPNYTILAFVLYKGIEPLSFERKSNALATMLIERLVADLGVEPKVTGYEPIVLPVTLIRYLSEEQDSNLRPLASKASKQPPLSLQI